MNGEWQTKKLAEVATLQRGFDLPTRERTAGAFPLVSSSGITDTHYKSAVRGPGVATGRSGSIGNVFFIKDDFWPLNTVLYVKDFHGNDQRFIFYLLQHFDLSRFATGVGVPTLNRNFVHDEIVRIPDLPEQRRIAGILDKAFAAIATAKANTEKNLQNARALFESELDAIFVLRGSNWTEKRVCEICRDITVGHVGPMVTRYRPSGIPFLRSQNVRPFEVTLDNMVFIDDDFHAELSKSQLKPGNLMIVRTGYPGTAAVVPESLPIANCSDMVIVKPDQHVDPHFMALFFNSNFGKSLVDGQLVGAAQKHFNIGAAKQVAMPFPPKSEQHRLVEAFHRLRESVTTLESLYRRKLVALHGLKQSVLRQALSGAL